LQFGADVALSRGAANRLDLASGDSLRIVSGQLQFGADVVLEHGAADRLDLASGDSLRIPSDGELQFGSDTTLERLAAGRLGINDGDGALKVKRIGIGVDPDDDYYVSLVDSAVVGCPSGPRIVFDDTNDYFEMTAGDVGIRTTTPAAALDVHKDSAQLRLTYASDTDKYAEFEVGSTGSLEIDTTSNIILDPGGNNVNPGGSIEDDLGAWNVKWRTLYAAELYVENLIAQDVMATIGGRIMVAPTTKLTTDVGDTATSIEVEHNNLAVNDYVYLCAAPGGVPQVEVMQIVSGPTGSGPYTYSVSGKRNLDGSGANSWTAGDAVVNLGYAANEGYLELTSTQTIHAHLGPTIAIYSRFGTANWNDSRPVVALGNLDSFLGYGEVYGLAMGNDLRLGAPTSHWFKGATLDRINGLRLFNTDLKLYDGSTPKVQVLHDEGILVSSGTWGTDTTVLAAVFADDGTVDSLDAGDVIIGRPFHSTVSSRVGIHWDNSASTLKLKRAELALYNGTTQTGSIQPDGDVKFGSNIGSVGSTFFQIFATAQTYDGESMGAGDVLLGDHGNANMLWDASAGQLKFRDGTNTQVYIDTDGSLMAGGGDVALDGDGLSLLDGDVESRAIRWVNTSSEWLSLISSHRGLHLSARDTPESSSCDVYLRTEDRTFSVFNVDLEVMLGSWLRGDVIIGEDGPYGDLRVHKGLYVGSTDTNPATGTITATDYICALGGLTVGSSTDPAGCLRVDGPSSGYTLRIESNTSSALIYAQNTIASNGYGMYLKVDNPGANTYLLNIMAGTAIGFYIYGDRRVGIGTGSSSKCSGPSLTINQGTKDGPILVLQSTDVGHGMTTNYDANTYATFRKMSPDYGGLRIDGVAEQAHALRLVGSGTGSDTTKSGSSKAAVLIDGYKKDAGTSITGLSGDENILAVRAGTTTRFVFKADGKFYSDAGTYQFDEYDDCALVRAVARETGNVIESQFDRFVRYNREMLEETGLVAFNDGGHHFVDVTGMSKLHSGAIWQLYVEKEQLKERVEALEQEIKLLKAA